MIKKETLQWPVSDCYLGFDAEWVKNYKVKNGNIPFCFSLVAVEKEYMEMKRLEEGKLPFRYIQLYTEDREETVSLIKSAENCAENVEKALKTCVLCGHQMTSDLSVLINMGHALHINEVDKLVMLQQSWHVRKQDQYSKILDTRYDIQRPFMRKSRRLVDICEDFNLNVIQPELKNTSMTKLQNLFWESKDLLLYERIAVMNIRHSLCSVILAWLDEQISYGRSVLPINVNKTIHYNLKDDFAWIHSDIFKELI